MGGAIRSEWVAASNRNGWRDQVGIRTKCPELNPVENIWQFMRDNWLSNRVFTSLRIPTIAAINSDRNQPLIPIEASRVFR